MFKEFKVGYWYKYVGDISSIEKYCDEKKYMKKIIDNKWHKCIETEYKCHANFEDLNKRDFKGLNRHYTWWWKIDDFIESKFNPDDRKKKLRKILNV